MNKKTPKFNLGDKVQFNVSKNLDGLIYHGIKKGEVVAIEASLTSDGYFQQLSFSYSIADSVYSKSNRWNNIQEESLTLQD